MTFLHRSSARLHLVLALALAACGVDSQPRPPDGVEQEVARLETELASHPGELMITRSSDMPFSDELETQLAKAGKVIHVYSDGTVGAYLGEPATNLPADVPAFRLFRELHGDIIVGNQDLLSSYLLQREPQKRPGISEAVGLPIGDGALWPDSTVAYTIDGSITGGDRSTVLNAITTWNRSVDPSGNQIKVRFVPRYPNDNRPYVSFVRGGGGCGSSQVGRHDHIFSNWWSHNININCFSQQTILHEMGHTAGLFHEQQRCDRDSFVSVGAPAGINCERYCGGAHADYGPYNYWSVMHYPYSTDPAACAIKQITPSAAGFRGNPWDAGTVTGLDTFDVQAINQMYLGRPSLPAIGSSRYYSLVPQHTSRVLVVPGGSTANDVQLLLWDRYAGVFDQHFSIHDDGEGFVEIRPRHAPWKCVEIYGFSTANGGAVKQWDCHTGANQKWILAPAAGAPGYFDIINKNSLKSVDVSGFGTANGTPIHQWDHHNGTNQRFALSPAF
jgi:hypothetical protein